MCGGRRASRRPPHIIFPSQSAVLRLRRRLALAPAWPGCQRLRRFRTGCCTGRRRSRRLASSSRWLPCSTMSPLFITRIRSALRMVDRRWAMMKLVRFCISESIAFWISTSVRVSTELVASSRIRILGSARKARAMVSSCFWPCEHVGGLFVQHHVVAVAAGCG